jgi:hypothetical protein
VALKQCHVIGAGVDHAHPLDVAPAGERFGKLRLVMSHDVMMTPCAINVNRLILSDMTEDEVRRLLKQACQKSGSVRAWATEHGLSAAYVGDVLASRRGPGSTILDALFLKKRVVYEYEFPQQETA